MEEKQQRKGSDSHGIVVSIKTELLVLSVGKEYSVLVCPNVLFLWNCVWKQYLAYGQVRRGGCPDTILECYSILHPQTNKKTDLVSLTKYLWQAFNKGKFLLLLY